MTRFTQYSDSPHHAVNLTVGNQYVFRVAQTGDMAAGETPLWSEWSGAITVQSVDTEFTPDGDLDLGDAKILYSNVYPTLADLPPAADYHGMFAHVHDYDGAGTGAAFYAHAGDWVRIADAGDLPTSLVRTLNGLTGAVTLSGDDGITVSQSGNQLTVKSSQTFTTLNGESGDLSLVAGDNIEVLTKDGVISISSTNHTTLNNLSGNITLSGNGLIEVKTDGQNITIYADNLPDTSLSAITLAGHGLRPDDSAQLELADDPPRDVSLLGFAEDGLRAVFSRQATADTDRAGTAPTYEVEFLPVGNIPSVIVADQVGEANRTLSVQGLVEAGQRWAELGVSSDNGTTWSTRRLTLEDDSGVVTLRSPPPGSLRSGERLLRVRGADTASNLASAQYGDNFTANYDVAGYHSPKILQSQCSGSGVSVVGVLAEEDLARTELDLAAANLRVGWLPDGGTATYSTTASTASGWLEYFAYTQQRNGNSTVFSSELTATPEGWGSLVARVEGDEGVGDVQIVSDIFFNFAGNYTLPKPPQADSTVFLVAAGATATNLPAGVTAGSFYGAIATRRDSPLSMFLAYHPDSSQEFEFEGGTASEITLNAQMAASDDGTALVIVEADGMYPRNDGNTNWTYTTEPTLAIEITDPSGNTVATQTATPVAGEATEVAVTCNLLADTVYAVTVTISHSNGSRALVPQVRVRSDQGGAK